MRQNTEEVGMTDKQFKSFLRLVIGQLEDIKGEMDEEKKNLKLDRIIKSLQKPLEDESEVYVKLQEAEEEAKHTDIRYSAEDILKEMRNLEYLKMLDTSIAEANDGKFVSKTIEELD